MELKDWKELLVPIITNGILNYLFQSLFSKKLEKKQGKATQIITIVRQYQLFAEKISDLLQNFTYSLDETEQNTILSQVFAVAAKELFPYFDRHSVILENFQNINSDTLICTNKLRDALSAQNRESAVIYLNELNKHIQMLSNECDAYILKKL